MNILITGTSQGIGLELTSHYLSKGDSVIAVARKPQDSVGLKQLEKEFGLHLTVLAIDLTEPAAPEKIHHKISDLTHLDLVINNAGINPSGESKAAFMSSFETNSVMPLLVTKAVFPQLKKSKNPRAAFISSLMGSIGDNTSGGHSAYRASKAALNMIVKTLSLDESWLNCTVIHPGWVKTRMGGASAPVSLSASIAGISKLIESSNSARSGHFYDFEGDELPW